MTTTIPEDEDVDVRAQRMLEAALGGLTPQQALLEAAEAERDNAAERAADIAKNRERAERLLAALEKSLK